MARKKVLRKDAVGRRDLDDVARPMAGREQKADAAKEFQDLVFLLTDRLARDPAALEAAISLLKRLMREGEEPPQG